MHPMFEELCRARGPQDVRPDVFRRWQQIARNEIQPLLDKTTELMDAEAERLAKTERRK
jgi:hypothetical protein